tara:strand:+ start:730 stop:1398 length:669 start_codon:yes stop_codon:yes gene_type:complete
MKATRESEAQLFLTGRAITWRQVTLFLFSSIALLGVLSTTALTEYEDTELLPRIFDLDRELNVPVAFSSSLLFLCGLLTTRLVRTHSFPKIVVGSLAALFVFMGFDEMLKIHETLEKIAGVDFQILYLPLIIVSGLGWATVWFRFKDLARWIWTAGAAAWVISQLLEAWQWGWWWNALMSKSETYQTLMISEELLEMAGSSLFVIALFRHCWPKGLKISSRT